MGYIRRLLFVFSVWLFCWRLPAQDVFPHDLRLQETKSYSKVELALQSVQNEIDGLRNLAETSLMNSERLTSELEESEMRSSNFESQLKSIGVSFSELSIAYNREKMKNQEKEIKNQKLITTLVIIVSITTLLAISYGVDLLMWLKKKKFLWWG